VFNQLARLSQLRVAQKSPPIAAAPIAAPSIMTPPPVSYQNGLGMGSSPVPMGQHLASQQTGFLSQPSQLQLNGPRGPYAPVAANQSLLQPLIPTNTGFNHFVPTRTGGGTSPFQAQPVQSSFLGGQNFQPSQPSFLNTQPTGFIASQPSQPSFLNSQPTGFAGNQQSILSQQTGLPNGNFGGYGNGGMFQNPGSFTPVQSNPTGFNPGFGQFNGVSPPPVPPLPSSNNVSPANIFAQMKSGTFASGNENTNPQSSDKYDALRPNYVQAQPTGWGYQNGNFQGGYGYQS